MGFSEKIQYIVMEYIDGITLKEYIEEEKVLTWKDTVHFVIQILRALQHAHDKGIVHRDIKPQNILVGYEADGLRARLSDFGLAKEVNPLTLLATAAGTLAFKPPEAFQGKKHSDSPAADVFAELREGYQP